ncbi:MAG: ROK family protein [bacterium]|nr:ROK family protein [bacterium]
MRDEPFIIGVDLGGTKILAVVCDKTGNIIARAQCETLASEGKDFVIDRMVWLIDKLLNDNLLDRQYWLGVGVGFPGLVNHKDGIAYSSIMLPGWHNVPLSVILTERLHTKVIIDNDANAATFGEWWIGAGKNAKTFLCLTIGTGIGGGIIINDRLYRGPDGTAGEFGNMSIQYNGGQCTCGNQGCLNVLASGTAIAKRAMEQIREGVNDSILEIVDGNVERITAEVVAMAARDGDPLAKQIISEAARFLGVGITNLVNIFNPDMVVLSGGVTQIGEGYFSEIRSEVNDRAFDIPAQRVKIVPAALGLEAGAIGAAGILLTTL